MQHMTAMVQVARRGARRWRDWLSDQRGEGVISTAIAVLIMAVIGLAMWVTFSRVFDNAGHKVENHVEEIG